MDRLHIFAPPPGAVNPKRRPGNLMLPPDQRGSDQHGRGRHSNIPIKRKRSNSFPESGNQNTENAQLVTTDNQTEDVVSVASTSSIGSTSSRYLQSDRPEGMVSGHPSRPASRPTPTSIGVEGHAVAESQTPAEAEQEEIAHAFRQLSPLDRQQYRTAGHDPRTSPPPPPFPAAAADAASSSLSSSAGPDVLTQAKQLLDAHRPTLYHAPALKFASLPGPRSRETHLAVMNTVLHRALLDGDFARAGRAFALLLRANPLGPRLLRRRDVCGIGAEILLRRPPNDDDDDEEEDDGEEDDGEEEELKRGSDAEPFISDRSFELVKDYLERLVVEHPLRVHGRVDQLNFWPSFFTLWIYQVLERAKHARKRARAARNVILEDSMTNSSDDDENDDDDADDGDDDEKHIRAQELDDARAIANRFDEIVQTAPCDKHPELLRLRGMLSQWVADLLPESPSESDPNPGRLSVSATSEVDIARAKELRIAEDMFARAEKESKPK